MLVVKSVFVSNGRMPLLITIQQNVFLFASHSTVMLYVAINVGSSRSNRCVSSASVAQLARVLGWCAYTGEWRVT